jgi:rubrerythrin
MQWKIKEIVKKYKYKCNSCGHLMTVNEPNDLPDKCVKCGEFEKF